MPLLLLIPSDLLSLLARTLHRHAVARRSIVTSGFTKAPARLLRWVASTAMRCPWIARLNSLWASTMACQTGIVGSMVSTCSLQLVHLHCQDLLATVSMVLGAAWRVRRLSLVTLHQVQACMVLETPLVSSLVILQLIDLLTIS